MAKFGAKEPCFKPDGAESGTVLGKLVSANLTVNLASGELFADDALAEQGSLFYSGNIAVELDDMTDDVAVEVFNAAESQDGSVVYSAGDNAPYGKLVYYKTLMRGGVKSWQGYYYPRVRAVLGNDNAQTKGSSITFQTTTVNFVIFEEEDTGVWRETVSFEDEADAAAWCEEMAAVAVVITEDPEDVSAAVGDTVTFHVAAKGGLLTYQWQYSSNGTTWNDSPTGKSETFSFTAASNLNGRKYRCVVTNGNGSETSEAATLTVTA